MDIIDDTMPTGSKADNGFMKNHIRHKSIEKYENIPLSNIIHERCSLVSGISASKGEPHSSTMIRTPRESNIIEDNESESIDSGCVADSIVEISKLNWQEVKLNLIKEYRFSVKLLQHAPRVVASSSQENDEEAIANSKKAFITNKVLTEKVKDKQIIACTSSTQSTNIELKKELERRLWKLKKGNVKNITPQERKREEAKIRKKLTVLRNKIRKKLKKINKMGDSGMNQMNKIYNHNGKLVFSKFDFSNPLAKEKWEENTKTKDLNSQLNLMFKEKEKMKMLKKRSLEEAAGLLSKSAWNDAFKKAEGVKVKDDPLKISKSIRRQKKNKENSGSKWKERERKVKQFRELREERKQRNKMRRKMKNFESKGKRKKTKIVKTKKKKKTPGF